MASSFGVDIVGECCGAVEIAGDNVIAEHIDNLALVLSSESDSCVGEVVALR